eukprot:gene32725-3610_t
MVNTSFYHNLGDGTAGVIFDQVPDAVMMQTEFADNHVQCGSNWNFCGGAAFQLTQGSRLLVKNCSFRRNTAHSGLSHGGAIYVHGGSELIVTSSYFANNSAAFGGAISAQGGSTLSVDPPWFDNICGCVGHAHEYLLGWNPFSKAVDNHWGKGYYFDVLEKEPLIDLEHFRPKQGTEFSENSAFSGGAVKVAYSSLFISSMNIDRNIPCACMGSPTSLSTRYEGNVALTGGAITSVGYKANTVIMSVEIYNNTALGGTPGNFAYTETLANIKYTSTISESESSGGGCGFGGGGGMCFSCGEASVETSRRSKCYGSISGTHFQANKAVYGGGLYVTADVHTCADPDECYTIPITRIIKTFPTPASTTRLQWASILQFSSIAGRDSFANRTIFIPVYPNNQVTWGDMYQIRSDFNVPDDYSDVEDTNYMAVWRNYKEEMDGSATLFTQNEAVGGAGGAIYMEQMATANITCDAVEASLTAQHDTLRHCHSWTGNTAKMGFGDIVATSPTAINISFSPKPSQDLNFDGSYQFTSGDELRFNVSLLDFWGRQHVPSVLNAKSMMTLVFSAQAYTSSSQREATNTSITWQVKKSFGTLDDLPTFSFLAPPGPHSVTVTSSSALGRYFPPYVFIFSVRPCKLGEYDPVWDAGPRCLPCDVGYYRIDEALTKCKVCPDDATCVNDTSLQHPSVSNPVLSFLMMDSSTAILSVLSSTNATQKVSNVIIQDTEKEQENTSGCEESGNGQSLHQDYFPKSGETKCAPGREEQGNVEEEVAPSEPCTPPQPAPLTSSLKRTHRIEARKNGSQEAGFITLAATWKVFVTYLQTLLMMQWIQKNTPILPASFSKVIGSVRAVFSTSTSVVSQECATSGNFVVDKRVLMVTVAATFPIMVYLVIGLYYLLLPVFHRASAWVKRRTSSISTDYESASSPSTDYVTKMITSAIVLLFYYYPTWVQVFLQMFLCYTINMEDREEETQLAKVSGLHYGPRWSYNLDLQCYEGQHAVLVYTMGIGGLIFVVTAPIFMAWSLFVNAYQLDCPRFRMKFGFLYEEYRHSQYLVTADQVPAGYDVMKVLLTITSIATISIFVLFMFKLWSDGMIMMVGLDPEEAMDMPWKDVLQIMLPEYKRKFKVLGRPLAILFLSLGHFRIEVEKACKRLVIWTTDGVSAVLDAGRTHHGGLSRTYSNHAHEVPLRKRHAGAASFEKGTQGHAQIQLSMNP